ncbi:hypothetical protein PITC_087530 [Penicillium italicum]|uniref:Uncharacterized protein n=1 Tax=Penicillium italicum TaxID=40296 RepID=A0A0A2KIA2_PENIT|nr:hypothetical protein PITC_087530 [Penicillium italicum]
MLFRPLFTTLLVLLLSFLATGAAIGARSVQISGSDNTFEATTQTILQPQPIHDAPSENALPPRFKHEDDDTVPGLHETTIDWREDGSESLRLESEREAGFLPSSHRGR